MFIAIIYSSSDTCKHANLHFLADGRIWLKNCSIFCEYIPFTLQASLLVSNAGISWLSQPKPQLPVAIHFEH